MIDLRSDTVTTPTIEMWDAMRQASLIDDTLQGDATVQSLEQLAAQILGKENALYVVSATMGNVIATLCHAGHGGEAVLDAQSHIANSEAGGISRLSHLFCVPVPSERGQMDLDILYSSVRGGFSRYGQPTAMVAIETSHNHSGGYVPSMQYLDDVHKFAHDAGVNVHIDGARLFNASVALGVAPASIAAHADSVVICLSKGLSAPMGAILAGSQSFIEKARTYRRMVGGGLRQAGIMAAAGRVALQSMVSRLADDHRRAQNLWDALRAIDEQLVNATPSHTNILQIQLGSQRQTDPQYWLDRLASAGIQARACAEHTLRLVTHRHISDEDVATVISVVQDIHRGQGA